MKIILFLYLLFSNAIKVYISPLSKPQNRVAYNSKENKFQSMSLNHLKEFTDYYSLPTLRRVTKNVFEIYYGGVKMCRDEVKGKVFGCDDNETFTKWEITEIFGNIITSFRDDTLLYNIIHDNQCLTVKEGGLIQMEECKKGENQIFSIKMVPIMPDFLFEGGPMEKYKEMKKSQKALLRKYKLESMFN